MVAEETWLRYPAYLVESDEEAVDEVSWVFRVQAVLVLLYFAPRKGLDFINFVKKM